MNTEQPDRSIPYWTARTWLRVTLGYSGYSSCGSEIPYSRASATALSTRRNSKRKAGRTPWIRPVRPWVRPSALGFGSQWATAATSFRQGPRRGRGRPH